MGTFKGRSLLAAAALSIAGLGSTAVNAASIDFGLLPYNNGDTVSSPISIGGFSITAVATNDVTPGAFVQFRKSTSFSYGLGVNVPGGSSGKRPISSSDTSGAVNETLGLIFDQTVDITTIQLADLDFTTDPLDPANQFVTVTYGTGATVGANQTGSTVFNSDGNVFHGTYYDEWTLSVNALGIDWIRVAPQDSPDGGGTELYWKGFGDVSAAVVPVPAAVWLFGSALGALGVLRRKSV